MVFQLYTALRKANTQSHKNISVKYIHLIKNCVNTNTGSIMESTYNTEYTGF